MAKLLKNLYNQTYLHVVINEIKKVYFEFDEADFEAFVLNDNFKSLELKQRMRHISTCIGLYLPFSYEKQINLVKKVFVNMPTKYSLENMIFQDFVEVYGLDDFKVSMEALECFTEECTSEFAIRQFILKYPEQTMKQMMTWTKSSSAHVRRLASEGSRPRLPWAIALRAFKTNPEKIIPILDTLKDDESAYVQKSVANSLNDISKDNPKIFKKLLKQWLYVDTVRDKILKHASRTLLKAWDKEVLELFAFTSLSHLHVENFNCSEVVKKEEYLEFSFVLKSKEELGKIRLEYMIEFLRQNGSYGKKVFKISEYSSTCRDKHISKKHSFKTISTRKYYSGVQKLSIVVNGVVIKYAEFSLN